MRVFLRRKGICTRDYPVSLYKNLNMWESGAQWLFKSNPIPIPILPPLSLTFYHSSSNTLASRVYVFSFSSKDTKLDRFFRCSELRNLQFYWTSCRLELKFWYKGKLLHRKRSSWASIEIIFIRKHRYYIRLKEFPFPTTYEHTNRSFLC